MAITGGIWVAIRGLVVTYSKRLEAVLHASSGTDRFRDKAELQEFELGAQKRTLATI